MPRGREFSHAYTDTRQMDGPVRAGARQNRAMTSSNDPRASPAPSAAPPYFGSTAQHVLVTGATGFIGRQLVRALRADGHTVSAWTRDPRAAGRLLGDGVRCVARLQDLPPTPSIDLVVNLAGAPIFGPRWTAARQATLLRSREGTTNTLVDWIGALAVKPSLLLSGSAIGYYGVQPQDDPRTLTEASPATPEFMSELCRRWEAAAHAATRHGVRVVCMRFGVVFGRGGGSLPKLLLPVRVGLGGRMGGGRQVLSWVHERDVLRAMAHVRDVASQAGAPMEPQVYNFTAPGALTQERFVRIAADVLHRPCILPTPGWPVRLALGEQSDLLLEGQRVAPERLLQTGFRFEFPDAKGALKDLC